MTAFARPVTTRRQDPTGGNLLALRPGDLWRYFRSQNLTYWAMCAYIVIEYVRPQNLIGFIYGAPLGQIAIITALGSLVLSGQWFSLRGAGGLLMLLFTGVILASSLGAYDPDTSFLALRDWMTWVVIFFLIITVVNTEKRFVVFLMAWLLCHYYMSQGGFKQFAMRGFAFKDWGIKGAPGWFANSGEFGIAMCMFVPISWHFYVIVRPHIGKWRRLLVLGMPATGVICIIGSSSRGALLGLAAVGAIMVVRSKKIFRSLAVIVVVGAAVWAIVPDQQKARFSSAGEDQTSMSRKTYWKNGLKMVEEHPMLGIGYNNWVRYYGAYYGDQVNKVYGVQVSHNIFIQCASELGYTGLVVFVMMIGATVVINARTRKAARGRLEPSCTFLTQLAYGLDGAMVGYLVSGFFVTVLYYPFFWINFAMTVALGAIAREPRTLVTPVQGKPENRTELVRGHRVLVPR